MIKIGLSGLGDHAIRAHVQHLMLRGDCQLVAGFDPANNAFQNVESQTGVVLNQYTSYANMLKKGNIDAVLISSPDSFHLQQLEQAVDCGLHVFCEKPLCTKEDELSRLSGILKSASSKGVVVTSCHPRRFDPPYVWLKNNLNDLRGKLGSILNVDLDFSYHKPSGDKLHLHGSSLLQDHANHEIDYISYLLGYSTFSAYKLHDTFNRYALIGRREDNISFSFSGTRRLENAIYPESIRVRFDKGEVLIDTYNEENSYLLSHETGKRQAITPSTTDYDIRFCDINYNWVNAMQGKQDNYLLTRDLLLNSEISVRFHNRDTWDFLNTLNISP